MPSPSTTTREIERPVTGDIAPLYSAHPALAAGEDPRLNALENEKYDPSLPLAFRIAALFGLRIEDVFQPE